MWFAPLEVIFQAKQVRFSSPADDRLVWMQQWRLGPDNKTLPDHVESKLNRMADLFELEFFFVFFFTVNLKDHSRLENLRVIRLRGVVRGGAGRAAAFAFTWSSFKERDRRGRPRSSSSF